MRQLLALHFSFGVLFTIFGLFNLVFCSYQLGFTQVFTNCGLHPNFGCFLSGCHYGFDCLDMLIALCLESNVGARLVLNLRFFVSVTYCDHGPQEVPSSFYAFLSRFLSHLSFTSLDSSLRLRLCASDVPSLGQVTQAVYFLRPFFAKQPSPPNSRFAVTVLLGLAAKTFALLFLVPGDLQMCP